MIDRWIMYGAHRFGRPGAWPREAHVKGWEIFNQQIGCWCPALLDRFGLLGASKVAERAD